MRTQSRAPSLQGYSRSKSIAAPKLRGTAAERYREPSIIRSLFSRHLLIRFGPAALNLALTQVLAPASSCPLGFRAREARMRINNWGKTCRSSAAFTLTWFIPKRATRIARSPRNRRTLVAGPMFDLMDAIYSKSENDCDIDHHFFALLPTESSRMTVVGICWWPI